MFAPLDRKEAEKYISRVDEWVKRFHKGYETIAAQAYTIPMKTQEEKTATDNLGHEFFVAVADYDLAKVEHSNHDDPLHLRIHYDMARCVQIVVDKARALKLLNVNDIEEKVELEKQLRQAHRRIIELENLVRLLGGDPSTASDTCSGNVEAGGNPDE